MTQVVRSRRADHRWKKEVDSSLDPGYAILDSGVEDLFDVGSVDGFEGEETLWGTKEEGKEEVSDRLID